MIKQSDIRNKCRSRKTNEVFSGLLELRRNFQSFRNKSMAWEDLHRLTRHKKKEIRAATAYAIGHVFPYLKNKEIAWNDLQYLISSEDEEIRRAAIFSVGQAFRYLPNKLLGWDALKISTWDESDPVRSEVAFAIGYAFPHIPDQEMASDALHRMSFDEAFSVRCEVAYAFGQVFLYVPNKGIAFNDLRYLSEDLNFDVRSEAAISFGQIYSYLPDQKKGYKLILQLINDKNPIVRINAIHSAGKVSIYLAGRMEDDAGFKRELENAIRFFEKAFRESERYHMFNPSKICLPLYRAFHAVTFQKDSSLQGVEQYLSDAKAALSGSETRGQLVQIIENLAGAIREVQNLSADNLLGIQNRLISCSIYCAKAETILVSIEGKTPAAARLMRRGARIIRRDMEGIKRDIFQEAIEICKITKDKGQPFDSLCANVCRIGKRLNEEENDIKVINEEVPALHRTVMEVFPGYDIQINEPLPSIPDEENRAIQLTHVHLELTKIKKLLLGIDSNVKEIQSNISELSQTILLRFDKNERLLVEVFIGELDNAQIQISHDIIEAIAQNRLRIDDIHELEKITAEMRRVLIENKTFFARQKDEIFDAINNFTAQSGVSQYNASHRIMVTVPLIPFLMNYQIIHEIQAGSKLEPLWKRIQTLWKQIT